MDALVVHYHEIGLKGRNRARFEEQLTGNLRRALRGTGYRRIRCRAGRIMVDFASPALVTHAGERAGHVFGV
ncbi:MAG TPA: tRNA 4-thiouridine(8) synthase ThiI, partial [Actinomycetota bacterium]|nr:tRNA 4-thiouridine(8) synthase ThiI [Actinomycetota bacterium]